MIEIVTFTGVDERTDLEELAEVADRYQFAEFGVLIGSATGEDNPIFPYMSTVNRLRVRLPSDRIAIHLCGRYARAAVDGHMAESMTSTIIHDITAGFGRIQVNLHGDVDSPDPIGMDTTTLVSFVNRCSAGRVILQHRRNWQDIPVRHPKLEYLYDLSGGRGEEGFEHWPEPPTGMRVGYAGGLGPHNIDRAIEFAARYPACPVWIDMERNVRTADYWFDMDKVRAVCRAINRP